MDPILFVYMGVALAFVAVLTIVVGFARVLARPGAVVDDRLKDLSRSGDAGDMRLLVGSRKDNLMEKFLGRLSVLVPQAFRPYDVRMMLVQAGYRRQSSVAVYLGSKLLVAIILPVALLSSGVLIGRGGTGFVWLAAALALLGWFLPNVYILRKISVRKTEIIHALPDALDLMVVCVEAGLGLNAAILRVGQETRLTSPALSTELRLVNQEILAGRPRAEALRNLAARTGVDDMKSLVAMLVQTDKLGTSIAASLRIQADSLRMKRRNRAEEAARKVAVKLVFPLVLFIFPELLVVLIGPGMLGLFRALSQVASGQ
jgi:tight adherence protein C